MSPTIVSRKQAAELSTFSTFFEKAIYNRLVEFAEKHGILYHYQFGFRKYHSTSYALLIHLVNNIASAIDQHKQRRVFSQIFPKHSTLSTIKSYLPNGSIVVYTTWLCSGLKVTFLAASNLSNSIMLALQCKPSSVVSLKVRF